MTIASDKATGASAGITHTLGALSIGTQQLNVAAGSNVGSGTAGLTFGTTTLSGAPVFDAAGSTNLTLGAVGGEFGITKQGVGQMLLNTPSSRSTSSGTTTLTAGTLRLGTGNALNSGGARFNFNGGTLALGVDTGATFQGTDLVVGGSPVTVQVDRNTGGPAVTNTLGTLSIGGQQLNVTGGSNVTSGTAGLTLGATTLSESPTWNITNPASGRTLLTVGAVTNGANTATLTGNGGFAQTGVWGSGAGGLTLGAGYSGVATLGQTNTYTGATTISGGTLLVTGSTAAGSAVAVNNTGTLGGTGTVGGSVSVNSGGQITGGDLGTVGTLTVGSLSFNGGTYQADFSGDTSDQISTAGAIDLNGGLRGLFNVNSQTGSTTDGNVFTLINNTSASGITNPPLTNAAVTDNPVINTKSTYPSYVGGTGANDFTLTAEGPVAIDLSTAGAYSIEAVTISSVTYVEVLQGSTVIDSRPLDSVSSFMLTNTSGGVETLTVDYTQSGSFFGTNITFVGLGHDSLYIKGNPLGGFAEVDFNYTGSLGSNGGCSGTVQQYTSGPALASTITYSGLAPIFDTSVTSVIVVNLPTAPLPGGATFNDAYLEESGSPSNPLRLRSNNSTFETTNFKDPTVSLRINRGNTTDTLTIPAANLADLTHTLTIGNTGAFAAVTVNGTVNLSASGATLTVQAGTINLNANATTNSTQDYNGAVKVGTAALNLSGTTVTFASTVDDAHAAGTDALTVTGAATFTGVVGATALKSLHVTGSTSFLTGANSVTTTTTQDYDGAVTLGSNTTLTANNGSAQLIHFQSTVSGATHSLAIGTVGAGTTTDAQFDAAVSSVTTLSVSGATAINTTSIGSTDNQTYTGSVTLGANTKLTANTGAAPKLVKFVSTVSGGTGYSLDIGDGTTTSNAEFDGDVSSLTTLTVSGTTAINTTSIGSTDNQTYTGGVTLGANATLTANTGGGAKSVWFKSTVGGGAHSLAIGSSGASTATNAQFDAAVSGATALSVSGTTAINTTSVGSTDNQTYAGAVTLGADTTLTANTGSAAKLVRFASTVTGATHNLTIGTTTGVIPDLTGVTDARFDAALSGVNALRVSGATAINTTSIGSTERQEYYSAVTLGSNTTLTSSGVDFYDAIVGGGKSLAIIGSSMFGDGAGTDTVTGLSTLSVGGGLWAWIVTNTVTTSGTQDYYNPVIVDYNPTFTGTTVRFHNHVESGPYNGATVAISGDAEIDQGVWKFDAGLGPTVRFDLLSVSGLATITYAPPTIYAGVQNYHDVRLTGSGQTYTFDATTLNVTGYFHGNGNAVSVLGTANLGTEVTGVTSFTADAIVTSGPTAVNAGTVTATGSLTYQDTVTLLGNVEFKAPTVRMEGNFVGGNHTATFTGNAVLGTSSTNSITGVTSLSVSGNATVNAGTVTTTGTQTYSGNVSLSADVSLSATTVQIDGNVTGGSHDLSITGAAVLGNAVGDSLTGVGVLDISSTANINAGTVRTSGSQTYDGGVTVSQNTTLSSTGAGDITFNSTIAGTSGLEERKNSEHNDDQPRHNQAPPVGGVAINEALINVVDNIRSRREEIIVCR